MAEEKYVGVEPAEADTVSSEYYAHRGLTKKTLEFYDIKTKLINGIPIETGFPYPQNRGVKIRSFEEKKFRAAGDMKDPDLFGMDRFDPGSLDSCTITAGEYDAPSIFQVTRGKTAAVSLPSGNLSQALKVCSKNYEWINSFKKIYICLDNDEVDKKTAKAISQLFDFNKVYQVRLTKYKDANDYVQKGEFDELFRAWDHAKRYSPDNIISQFNDIRKALNTVKEDQIGTYPFSELNKMLYGLHRGEIITVFSVSAQTGASGTGTGKTEFFRALEHHLLKTTTSNIGIIHLEEDSSMTIKAIAGYELRRPATLPEHVTGLSKEDIFEGYRLAVGDKDDRVHIYTSFELQDENALLDNIRFLATAAKCDFIFLDHITWLATGLEQSSATEKLDRISQRLKLLAKELRVCIVMISHTNDDGRTRGSRNIEFVSNTMIKLVRDKENPDESLRNIISLSIPKARLGGKSGPAGQIYMEEETGRLEELKQEPVEQFKF